MFDSYRTNRGWEIYTFDSCCMNPSSYDTESGVIRAYNGYRLATAVSYAQLSRSKVHQLGVVKIASPCSHLFYKVFV